MAQRYFSSKDSLGDADTPTPRYHIVVKIKVKKDPEFEKQRLERRLEKEERRAEREAEKAAKEAAKKESGGIKSNLKALGGKLLCRMAIGGAALLSRNADEVNRLNVFPVPDGDTGDNMRMTIESGIAAIENMDSDDLGEIMNALSHGMLLGARGNSGVILSQFFAGTAKGFLGKETADPTVLGHALELGVQQAYGSVMTPTEGTILTVAREAVEYAVSHITSESNIRTFFADLVKEMHASLDRTPEILTVLKEAGVVDSGGAGLLYIMDGFNRVLNGEEILLDNRGGSDKPAPKPTVFAFNADSEMTYGYCTELLVQITRRKADPDHFDVDALKAFLSEIGDSIVAFVTDGIVKIHVHTFTPDKVLAHCLTFGEFLTVKIENMSVQHTELSTAGEDAPAPVQKNQDEDKPTAPQIKKRYGIAAVSNGPGIDALFTELGVDQIISGGQTQNPSTNDFLAAFEKIPAEHIFVFPNNGNILMAAQQAAALYKDAMIHVIPSKSIGSGYVAISTADLTAEDPDFIESAMKEAMSHATAGYVSPSIRDAEIGGVKIKKGDTIGVIEKEIILSEEICLTAAERLASRMLNLPEKFMLTIFVGKDATESDTEALTEFLTKEFPHSEVYFIDGGQDIYPYLFVAE